MKNWKKNGTVKVSKKSYRTNTSEIINQYMNVVSQDDEKFDAPVTIIDMRHKETRIITDLADLNNHSKLESYLEEQSKLAPKLGQELLYNINLITEQQDQELARLSRNLSVETKKWNMLQEERLQHGTQSEEHEERLHHLTKLLSVLERVNVSIASPDSTSSPSVITLEAVIQLMQTLYDNFPEEFTIFGLIDLLPDLLSRTADLSQQEWQPLSHSQSSHLLVDLCEKWTPLTTFFSDRAESVLASQTAAVFHSTLEAQYLPAIRRALSNDWEVLQQPAEPCVELLQTVRVVFPQAVFEQTVDLLVLPRLSAAVLAWRPFVDPPAHTWLHPWLPLLQGKLSAVYPNLRRQMSKALSTGMRKWEVTQRAVEMLQPWQGVFDAASLDSLLQRQVLPQLVLSLREGLQISPQQQDLEPFRCVMSWQHLLPPLHLSCLFAGEFFPKWLGVLAQWLASPSADFGEISEWYSGWKSMFQQTALEKDEAILGYFNLALEMMQSVLTYDADDNLDGNTQGGPLAQFQDVLRAVSSNNYLKQLESRKQEMRVEQTRQQHQQAVKNAKHTASLSISFKEVVEAFAELYNVEFTPKVGKLLEGKQLWQFGRCVCYMEHNVVFVQEGNVSSALKEKDRRWMPVDLEELLLMAR